MEFITSKYVDIKTYLKEIETKLKAPFRPDEIEYRISAKTADKTKGLAVAYIQARAVQNRLDEVLGFTNWKNEIIETANGKICGLSLRINDEWITKYDGADNTKIEATKGGISDSLKRAAVQWGIGRYLYNLPGQWVKIKNTYKDNYEIVERPKLPNWALPDELQQKQPTFKEINKGAEIKQAKSKLSDDIESCIEAFEKIGVNKYELENYLCLEADTFTDKDLDTLRTVYGEITQLGKKKEDFFRPVETTKKGQQTLKLEQKLKGE
jgi:hypothetical protein